jgi:hypothetical protein
VKDKEFYNRVTECKKDIVGEFLEIVEKSGIPYCVIGGIGVNAYCEPIVTLDFDCVILKEKINSLRKKLKEKGYKIKNHPHTWEVRSNCSKVKIQIQKDERYQPFIKKAKVKKVLGYKLKVASKEDILYGKMWAYKDEEKNTLKREKDLLDIKRMISKYPSLRGILGNFKEGK